MAPGDTGDGVGDGPADLVLRARRVHSFASEEPHEAVAIRDGRIAGLGRDVDQLGALVGPRTAIVDARDAVVLPGFFDTHVHQLHGALDLPTVQLDDVGTIAGLLQRVTAAADALPPGSWVVTSKNWHESQLDEGRLPYGHELDGAAPHHPVCVRRGSHLVVVNTPARRLAGVDRRSPDPPGGSIGRLASGEPDGRLFGDGAIAGTLALLPPPTFAGQVQALGEMGRRYNARGMVAVRDPGVSRSELAVYEALRQAGRLTLRTNLLMRMDEGWPADRVLDEIRELQPSAGDDLLRVDGVKLFVDGRIDGAARWPDEDSGVLHFGPGELEACVDAAVGRRWDVGCHAVGDRAVSMVLDAYERALANHPGVPARSLVVEHALLAPRPVIDRAARLGVGISLHPPLLYAFAAEMLACWGPDLTAVAGAARSWVEAGALVAAGSDGNVPPFDPLLSIWCLLTRGTRSCGVQGPDEAVDRRTAFRLYTTDGARLLGQADRRGALTAGRFADLVAYRTDPMTCPVDDLPSLSPVLTLMGGGAVHDPEGRVPATAGPVS